MGSRNILVFGGNTENVKYIIKITKQGIENIILTLLHTFIFSVTYPASDTIKAVI